MQIIPIRPGALYSALKTFPKNPTVKDTSKQWFVYFFYQHEGEWRKVKRKDQINRIKTFKEKLKELSALKRSLVFSLEEGFNPISGKFNQDKQKGKYDHLFNDDFTLIQALDFALSKADLSPSTLKNYSGCIRRIKTCIKEMDLSHLLIRDGRRKHFRALVDYAATKYKWTEKSYNKYLGYLKGVLSHLVQWEILEYNPAHKIPSKAIFEGPRKYVPYTEEEKRLIAEHLFLYHYGYFVCFMTQYHTGIRPMEVLALKISDLDFERQLITIAPDRGKRNSKTKKLREIQINDHLAPLLREWVKGIENKECFVFGSPYEPGKGNKGSVKGRQGDGARHPDYFKPSTTRIKRDTITKFWKSIVIDGLGINKYQYAAKHTGTDDRLLAGIPLEALRDMYGHSESFMTARYQTVLKQLHRQEINEKAKPFY